MRGAGLSTRGTRVKEHSARQSEWATPDNVHSNKSMEQAEGVNPCCREKPVSVWVSQQHSRVGKHTVERDRPAETSFAQMSAVCRGLPSRSVACSDSDHWKGTAEGAPLETLDVLARSFIVEHVALFADMEL